MNMLPCLPLLLGLATAALPATSNATDPAAATRGLLPVPANKLVGFWRTDIYVSFEACSPGAPEPPLIGHNTMVFNTGGTLVENPQVSPPGIPGQPQIRSFGLGHWSYNLRTGRHTALVRFDWYSSSNGAWLGYQQIDRSIQLSHDRKTAYGPVVSTRFAPDGTVLGRMCGHAVSRRL